MEWLLKLAEAENKEVFLSNIKLFVDYMWDQDRYYVALDGIIHLVYAIMLSADAIFWDEEILMKKILIIFTGVLILKEIF